MHEQLIESFALDGRVAVVTGAASGIGAETARVLAQAGAAVVLGDVQQAGLDEVAASIAALGGRAIPLRTDVATRAEVDALAARALEAFGRVDVWVNSAGIMVQTPMLDARGEELDRGIGVNLKGVYWGCVAAARAMQRSGPQSGGGSIVNVSSAGGESGVPGMSIYSLTKAAVNMVTRNAAKEFGCHGIRVNTVSPGWVDTPMGGHAYTDSASGAVIDPALRDEIIGQRASVSPLGLTGLPRDIALAILYLASDASRFMTGQILRPNGGIAMP